MADEQELNLVVSSAMAAEVSFPATISPQTRLKRPFSQVDKEATDTGRATSSSIPPLKKARIPSPSRQQTYSATRPDFIALEALSLDGQSTLSSVKSITEQYHGKMHSIRQGIGSELSSPSPSPSPSSSPSSLLLPKKPLRKNNVIRSQTQEPPHTPAFPRSSLHPSTELCPPREGSHRLAQIEDREDHASVFQNSSGQDESRVVNLDEPSSKNSLMNTHQDRVPGVL
ncbi:hypothetical protein BT69DRAFT_741251 [Atractiella rhizophila]|nr:hypothetical protein BT69DRAFT_741251 [Atractiella rhizophila]